LAGAVAMMFSPLRSRATGSGQSIAAAASSVAARIPSANDQSAISDANKMPSKPAPAQSSSSPVIGRWLLNDSIRREINIRPDGTATMDVKLDYLSSFLYGKELHLELTWKLENNVLTHSIISGTPEDNVKRLTHDFGDSRSYDVVSITDKEMVLRPPNGGELLHWIAIKSPSD
jgi:hypothetical protein